MRLSDGQGTRPKNPPFPNPASVLYFALYRMNPESPTRIKVIDSHTAGEPTRVVVAGASSPTGATMEEKRASFQRDMDWLRSASVCEPRGHDALVGALLCEPVNPGSVAGVIFFNNVGVLHGCLHGTMGVAVTLLHMGRIGPGEHRLDTSTGVVTFRVSPSGQVTVRNIRSYRWQSGVTVTVPGHGTVTGDIAWGGNWFFLTDVPAGLSLSLSSLEELTDHAWAVRQQLEANGVTGEDGGEIDHIELFGPPTDPARADSRNFVLCPGKAYDRSPCGTGTSAKLACLHAAGKLGTGQTWRQAGILDTVFEGSVEPAPEGGVFPTVTGSAFVTLEADLLIDPSTPFAFGITPI
jgi:4-hydroxyproline epimerase